MKSSVLCLIFAFVYASAFAQQAEFIQNLKPYCGETYLGTPVYPEGDANPFAGNELLVVFETCEDKVLKMPFWVGEDKSRTWILTLEDDGKLLFKHDHRHADGTPDEITNYGGYANTSGSSSSQFFPADAFTADLIPAAATNEWAFVFDAEKETLAYILKRDGQLRFSVSFDLSTPKK